jgi:hypothetical protein
MTHNTTQPETIEGKPSNVVAKPQTIAMTVRGQKYIPPQGRHSQQSHRRAQARAAAQGDATVQDQHAHDRSNVKAELGRLAALKVTQKPNPPK